ncbi:hypothetical protein E2C01_019115 [Portunus trituberculatus]|uniref:Uncharacterized protein n=1 Tax=Portunus trituberculatus TaxID=210409 RepID=A0A5B7DX13_PORTR|nr:hypothetical protein [Portunus trituberculatus]
MSGHHYLPSTTTNNPTLFPPPPATFSLPPPLPEAPALLTPASLHRSAPTKGYLSLVTPGAGKGCCRDS